MIMQLKEVLMNQLSLERFVYFTNLLSFSESSSVKLCTIPWLFFVIP